MRGKSKILISTMLVFVLFLSSCTKKEVPLGHIEDVEITIEEKESEDVFTKEENELGYITKRIDDQRAHYSFEIPSSWRVDIRSGRVYQISAPSNDPHLPNALILVYHAYNYTSGDYIDAYSMPQVFSDEINESSYKIGLESYTPLDITSPDEIVDDPSFTNGHADLVSIQYHEGVTLMQGKTKVLPEEYSIINTYVNWDGVPTLFSMVIPLDKKDIGIKFMRYTISSMKHSSPRVESQVEFSIGKISTTLPSGFTQDGNIFYPEGLSPLSGISIGVFHHRGTVDESYLEKELDSPLSNCLMISGSFMPGVYKDERDITLSGLNTSCYTGSAAFIPGERNLNSYYGVGGNIEYIIYAIESKETNYIVMITFDQARMELAKRISQMIESSIVVS